MYEPPIIKNGVKVYQLNSLFRRQFVQAFFFAFVVGVVLRFMP